MSDDRDLLAAVLESTSALVVVLSRDGIVLKFNRACELVSGYRFEEVQGRRLGSIGLVPEPERLLGLDRFTNIDPRFFPRSHEGTWESRTRGRRIVTWTDTAIMAMDGSLKAIVRTGVDVTEHRRAERRLATQFETLRVLAGSEEAEEAIVHCLEAITRGLGLEIGEYWALDETTNLLRLAKTWRSSLPALRAFEQISRGYAFAKGQGLPGRIWAGGPSSWWVEDLAHDPQFLPTAPALESGLRGGFGFPIIDGDTLLGVMTFFTTEVLSSDPALTATMASLGAQIGEFLRRRRAEDELAKSESRNAAILEAALDGIIFTDEQGRILEFNRAAEMTFGLARAEVLGKPMADLILPAESLEVHRRALEGSLTPGQNPSPRKPIELPALRHNGDIFPAEVTVVPFQLDDRPGLTSCIRDLSERKSAEQSLRESEERLGTVMTEAPVVLFTFDAQGVITLAEGKALHGLGLTAADLVGKSIFDLYAKDTKVLSDIRRSLTGEAFVACAEVRGITLEVHYSPLRGPSGEDRGVIGVALDITERRRTEERLRMFAALVENSGDFIAMADANGTVTYINAAGRALVGLEARDDLPARTISQFLDDKTRSLIETEALPAVVAQGHWVGAGKVVHSKTRALIDVQISLFLVREAETDQALCLATILRDVTERTRVEEELTRAKDAAEAGSRAKSEFLANMSHEIRTPLTAILGSSDMLQDRSLPDELHNLALETISRNGEHLLQIINNLLDLSKLEAERSEPEFAMTSPAAILAEVLSALNVQAKGKSIELVAAAEGPIPRQFRTDPIRLRQILFNLIGNAIKFTNKGTIGVKLGLESSGGSAQGHLVFEVRDQGIGMTAEQLAHLFTPFYQADSSHTRVFGGTGLGLYISQRLAESLGGEILVESRVRVGSCFRLRLPTTLDASDELFDTHDDLFAVIGSRASAVELPVGPLFGRILLVEDSRDNQRVVSYYLERLGLAIEIAENGRTAVEMATARPYELILMDMQMPELDGYAATRRLRDQGYSQPIIALTAHALSGDAEKCLAAGCDDYLRKPVEWERLSSVLYRYLDLQAEDRKPEREQKEASPDGRLPSTVGEDPPLVSDFAGDPGFMVLIRDYVDDLAIRIREFRQNFADRHLEVLRGLAHNLKGSGGMYGYSELSEIAGLLEDAVRENRDTDLIGALVDEVVGVIGRIERGLVLTDGVNRGESRNA